MILGAFLTILLTAGCSQKVGQEIIGTWEAIEDKCRSASRIGEKVTFFDDNTVAGIEGYQEYLIEEIKNEDYDYAVLSGGYEDVSKAKFFITEDKVLKIVHENREDDLDGFYSCHLEKVSE